ncbi:pantoate--beta-alanine ligase [Thermosipho melanesiensis]|uniref:Pantothenate synthetase n=2 Tax=Thermosipho melanesiensis TaxID=46541 RepID=PANC_THEM4|nr:pantoate--beta-alanine ligase [Thermosipho melanesiensis]A6LNF3.1 RecName: Full=Pantothenate synthetase; Short=PS; AltName: Full=Pantoate--beta-alanine ligase; AltName: Full=Pantoate-activating enzyme [Thermosipho melanesiensis BI429]ABR31454.1 pantoate--beta-alanine ligase [Thermosipho melanesiensis BI429]APT74513.1 pantoate--beta-alanine ligase [Thermosipho melanesiensis]OOC36467.1 pantoate--beta-alanine ligase [Thermosipho melanesiensis]OOC37285.1 pantoate--beta-alanine ligase [Thermosip
MEVIKSIDKMKQISFENILKGKKIGFVPTMGYLHEGHLSLVRAAREENDILVVSIFVNPTQFGPNEDFESYPRDLKRDLSLLEKENVDYVFVPEVSDMYPNDYSTFVEEVVLSKFLCGASRPGHFRGVCTVVTKFFNIVKPTRAYFGQKDAQQFRVLRRMVRDLNLDVELREMPIVRELDGLAMSSRNTYLNDVERNEATRLYKSLLKAKELIEKGEKDVLKIKDEMKKILDHPLLKIDYIEFVDEETLRPVEKIEGKVIVAIAVFVGKARLIDNIIVGG